MLDSCTALQASVANGSIRLADNGARLAGRLAQLHDDIARQSELAQMYAEQLGPNTAPAMQDDLHGSSARNNPSWQVGVEQEQQQPVPSSRDTQMAGQQQKLMHGVTNTHAPQQTGPRTESQHGALGSAPALGRTSSRHSAVDRRARSSADKLHQHDPHSNGGSHRAEGRGRHAGAARQHRQAGQPLNAGKGRQRSVATDSRYHTTDGNTLSFWNMVALNRP